jgi:hypothetical protein
MRATERGGVEEEEGDEWSVRLWKQEGGGSSSRNLNSVKSIPAMGDIDRTASTLRPPPTRRCVALCLDQRIHPPASHAVTNDVSGCSANAHARTHPHRSSLPHLCSPVRSLRPCPVLFSRFSDHPTAETEPCGVPHSLLHGPLPSAFQLHLRE